VTWHLDFEAFLKKEGKGEEARCERKVVGWAEGEIAPPAWATQGGGLPLGGVRRRALLRRCPYLEREDEKKKDHESKP